VIINTDVDGVMTADPGIVKSAYPVKHLSYLEAVELAQYGTRLFHPRTFLPLINTQVRV
jgi:aspartokinase/homoserine dehydrogenase 1